MSSASILTAVVERLVEKTKAKNPGVDIKQRPLSQSRRNIARRALAAKKRGIKCTSSSGSLH